MCIVCVDIRGHDEKILCRNDQWSYFEKYNIGKKPINRNNCLH